MKNEIETLCEQIISAANSVYVKGCDDVAMLTIAQLRGIRQSAQRIKQIIKEDDTDA